jgi:hypothetical protein
MIVLIAIPSVILLKRVGLSRAWALVSIIPLIGTLVILWLVALRRWPAVLEGASKQAAVFD